MKKLMIQEKLIEMGVYLEDIKMGDFDIIGEYTARKNRDQNSENYRKHGCFFRPNYERGILLYYLVRKNQLSSILEVGFGRGYGTLCMAKAMCDHGIDGKITTVDPNFNREHIENLSKIFPKNWFEKIEFISATSSDFYANNTDREFDFIFIDGDHRYDYVKKDWEFAKTNCKKLVLFDDYHLPDKNETDIEVSKLVDDINDLNKELIIMDRRMFFDDRRIKDEDVNYGQVLVDLLGN